MQAQVGIAEEYYHNNSNVIIITALADVNVQSQCTNWNNYSPNITTLIVEDDNTIFNWFNSQNGFPSTVFINEEMQVQYKANYINNYYIKGYIDDMLLDCGDDCISDPSAALFEYIVDDLTVSFLDLSQDVNIPIITNWFWDFGDGITSLEPSPIHTYSSAGTYFVTLDIIDQYGASGLQYWEYITLDDSGSCEMSLGDVTGDGNVNILDIVQLANYITGSNSIDYLCAADFNGDVNINILDIVQIANYIIEN